MYCVVNTNDMLAKLASLAESVEYRVNHLLSEQKAIADDHIELLRVTESFALPSTKQKEDKEHPERSQQCRFIPSLMTEAGAAGLILSNAFKNAACTVLFFFELCTNNKDLKGTFQTSGPNLILSLKP